MPEPPSVILYQDCSKLPLEIYVDCLEGDLTGLGTGDMQGVWGKIFAQALQISQNGAYNEVFELTKEIDNISAKIRIVDSAIKYLEMAYDEEVVGVLNSFGLRCNITPEDTGGALVFKLNAVIGRMKKWFPALNKAKKDLEELRKTVGAKNVRRYFDDWLEAMSDAKGYLIEAGKITVSRFYLIMEKMRADEVKRTAEKNKKK